MRQLLLVLVLCLAPLGAAVLAQDASSPLGTWKTIDDETGDAKSLVQIYRGDDGKVYGKVVRILKASEDAARNEEGVIICSKCDGAKKNQPVEGMVIIEGLEKDGDTWSGGTILDPAKGKTYKAKLQRDGENLKVRGFIGFSLLGRTQTWLPADSASAGT